MIAKEREGTLVWLKAGDAWQDHDVCEVVHPYTKTHEVGVVRLLQGSVHPAEIVLAVPVGGEYWSVGSKVTYHEELSYRPRRWSPPPEQPRQ